MPQSGMYKSGGLGYKFGARVGVKSLKKYYFLSLSLSAVNRCLSIWASPRRQNVFDVVRNVRGYSLSLILKPQHQLNSSKGLGNRPIYDKAFKRCAGPMLGGTLVHPNG